MSPRSREALDLDRLRVLARELADSEPGDAGELACMLADAVIAVAGRVEELWQLIGAALEAAGLAGSAIAGPPPAEFVQALTSPRGSGQGIRLTIGGVDWVAAISQDQPAGDPAAAWAALERLALAAADDEDHD